MYHMYDYTYRSAAATGYLPLGTWYHMYLRSARVGYGGKKLQLAGFHVNVWLSWTENWHSVDTRVKKYTRYISGARKYELRFTEPCPFHATSKGGKKKKRRGSLYIHQTWWKYKYTYVSYIPFIVSTSSILQRHANRNSTISRPVIHLQIMTPRRNSYSYFCWLMLVSPPRPSRADSITDPPHNLLVNQPIDRNRRLLRNETWTCSLKCEFQKTSSSTKECEGNATTPIHSSGGYPPEIGAMIQLMPTKRNAKLKSLVLAFVSGRF